MHIYLRGESVSINSLFNGATVEDVRYSPMMFRAFLVRKSFGGGPRKEITIRPKPFGRSENQWQN